MSLTILLGILLFFAGAHLLWQARREIFYWMAEFFRILRGEVSRRGGLVADAPGSVRAESRRGLANSASGSRGTLRLLGGFGLVILGPLLILLSLAFHYLD